LRSTFFFKRQVSARSALFDIDENRFEILDILDLSKFFGHALTSRYCGKPPRNECSDQRTRLRPKAVLREKSQPRLK